MNVVKTREDNIFAQFSCNGWLSNWAAGCRANILNGIYGRKIVQEINSIQVRLCAMHMLEQLSKSQ